MSDVYIVEAKRTAIGTFGGSLEPLSAIDLGVTVVKEVMNNLGLNNDDVDEVIMGNVFKAGLKGNPARQVAIHAGLHEATPAITIDKQCGSGLKALMLGANEIRLCQADLVITGGIESMSNVPHVVLNGRWGSKLGDLKTVDSLLYDGLHCALENVHMGVTAENLAKKYNISREEQDEYALRSQERAAQAIESGRFNDEIVPVTIKGRKGETVFAVDEHPRKTTLDKLGSLPAVFQKDGTVTAGNASGLNDGAAVVVLSSEKAVKEHNLQPIGKVVSYASAAVDPSIMGIGPVPASQKALQLANMTIDDIDLVEVNEAFAAQVLAVNKELNIADDKLNVNGGAIALGHPVGCSGSRIVVSLLHELKKRNEKLGLASLCIGGGQGVTTIIESI